MSSSISIEFPPTADKIEAEKQKQPEFDLIKITNVPSTQDGLQILSQNWFKEIICNHEKIWGIYFLANENIMRNCNQRPNFLDFSNKPSIFITFQSTLDEHESRTFWKIPGREKFYSTFVENDNNEVAITFLHESIILGMKEGNSGVLRSFEDKDEVRIHEIGDDEDSNLLIIASFWIRTNVVQKLLDYTFDVDYVDDFGRSAIDYSWENSNKADNDQVKKDESNKIILCLLRANSRLPIEFDYNKASIDVQAFVDMCEGLHRDVQDNNFNDLRLKIERQPNLVHFYNRDNKSLLSFALELKKMEIVSMLDKGLSTGYHEDLDEVYKNLSRGDYRSIRSQHQQNSIQSSEAHLLVLKLKSRISNNDQFSHTRWDSIEEAYKKINSNKYCSKILKVAAKCKKLKIFFDFKHDSTYYMDPATSVYSKGIIYEGGSIIIGAKYLADDSEKHKVIGVLAHELCHLAVYMAFMNRNFDPFPLGESKQKTRFVEDVMEECDLFKEMEPIVENVFTSYRQELQHSEMIVTYPQMLMHYYGDEIKLKKLSQRFNELVKYSEKIVEPELDRALPILEKLEDDSKEVKYEELTEPMRAKILHTKIKFQGVETSFHELIGNDQAIFKLLTSSQIRQIIMTNTTIEIGKMCITELKNEVIERTFIECKSSEVNEETVKKSLLQLKDEVKNSKIFILADHAGTGKTTAFTTIALELKMENRNFWVSLINLGSCASIFEKFINKAENLSSNDVEQIFQEIVGIKSRIEETVFQKLYSESKVIFLLDGFDEICPKYSGLIMSIFKAPKFGEKNFWYGKLELWISTRPNCAQTLEYLFKVSAHKFEPYTREENEKFIRGILSNSNIRNEDEQTRYLTQIIKFIKAIEESERNHNPLMVQIITELYISKASKLDSSGRYGIYAAMIKRQKDIVGDRIPLSERDNVSTFNVWDVHQVLALILIIGDNYEAELGFKVEELPITKKWLLERENWTSDMIQRYGFVTVDLSKPKDGANSINFTHRSYAEFFVAQLAVNFMFSNCNDFSCDAKRKLIIFLKNLRHFEVVVDFIISYEKNEAKAKGKSVEKEVASFMRKEIADFSSLQSYHLKRRYVRFFLRFFPSSGKPIDDVKKFMILIKTAEVFFGSSWHEEFNQSGTKLITDEEIEKLLDKNLEVSKLREDKRLIKIWDLVDKNRKYFQLVYNLYNETRHQSLCDFEEARCFLNHLTLYPLGCSGQIQTEVISRMQYKRTFFLERFFNIHTFENLIFKSICLFESDYSLIPYETIVRVYDGIEKSYTGLGIRINLFLTNLGYRLPLFKVFMTNDQEKLNLTKSIYMKNAYSWKEVFDCILEHHLADILLPLNSRLYSEYKNLLTEAYGTDTSKLANYLESRPYEHYQVNEENLLDFLNFIFANDEVKVRTIFQKHLENNAETTCSEKKLVRNLELAAEINELINSICRLVLLNLLLIKLLILTNLLFDYLEYRQFSSGFLRIK